MKSPRNISEFILLGLSYDQNIQIFCSVLFLFSYVALLAGNLLILVSIRLSPLYHQPMYYFLSHLSSMDICYTSMVTPKLIADLQRGTKTISYGDCMLQLFAVHFFGGVEIFILTAMAFDRYAAICKPLHYVIIMNRTRCHLLVLAAWGPVIFIYLRPPTTFPEDKIFALFYTIIAPMFNPLIYTLRNLEMKKAMKKVWCPSLFPKEAHS
uniref:G-protein coupled receptors family 1 profile domain-containing protein n=1 Tax=Ailuropoda melanoleuca TaxID=9646 RepID=G1MP43_AILME